VPNFKRLKIFRNKIPLLHSFMVDSEYYEVLSVHKWGLKNGLVHNKENLTPFHIIADKLKITEHQKQFPLFRNGNCLDYRGKNFLTWVDKRPQYKIYKQDSKNATGVKGVTKRGKNYRARVCKAKKQIVLGTFDTLHAAANAVKNFNRANESNIDTYFDDLLMAIKEDRKTKKAMLKLLTYVSEKLKC